MKNTRLISALALVALSLAACSATPSDTDTAVAATRTPTTTPTQTASPSSVPVSPSATSDTDADTDFTSGMVESENWPSLDAQMVPVATRIGVHDGYDRVVVEYTDAQAEPSWHSDGWADQALSSGRGDVIDVYGTRSLQIFVGGIAYPETTGELPNLTPEVPAGSFITGVDVEYGFEGQHGITIGADADHDYRISYLSNPSRIVIDIKQ